MNRFVAAGALAGRQELRPFCMDLMYSRIARHRIAAEIIDDVAETDICGTAQRDEVRETDVALTCPIEHGCADGRGLRDESNLPRLACGRYSHSGRYLNHHAHAVGTENAQPARRASSRRFSGLAMRCAVRSSGSCASRIAARVPREPSARMSSRAVGNGEADDREVGSDRQVLDPPVGEHAANSSIGGTDRHDRPLEAAMQEVLHHDLTGSALTIAGADDGDGSRVEELVEVEDRHLKCDRALNLTLSGPFP